MRNQNWCWQLVFMSGPLNLTWLRLTFPFFLLFLCLPIKFHFHTFIHSFGSDGTVVVQSSDGQSFNSLPSVCRSWAGCWNPHSSRCCIMGVCVSVWVNFFCSRWALPSVYVCVCMYVWGDECCLVEVVKMTRKAPCAVYSPVRAAQESTADSKQGTTTWIKSNIKNNKCIYS